MASQLEIQVQNIKLKIIVGSGSGSGSSTGGDGPGDPSSDTASGAPQSRGGGNQWGPLVVGPILVPGGGGPNGATGGDGPGDPSSDTASGAPKGGDGPGDPSSDTASGAPQSQGGGRGWAPVVVGPIVFGYSSDGGEGGASAAKTLQPISVQPPTSPAQNTAPGFVMQEQEQTDWCWDAVTVSVHEFLDPPIAFLAPQQWTQGSLATNLLSAQYPGQQIDCGIPPQNVGLCNQAERLDTALTITNNLRTNGYLQNPLTFSSLQGWLNMNFPVCARIAWAGGGAHFIAFDACWVSATGEQKVSVQDPLYGPNVQTYQDLIGNYHNLGGTWQQTYLTVQ
jgi:hypothetical protein